MEKIRSWPRWLRLTFYSVVVLACMICIWLGFAPPIDDKVSEDGPTAEEQAQFFQATVDAFYTQNAPQIAAPKLSEDEVQTAVAGTMSVLDATAAGSLSPEEVQTAVAGTMSVLDATAGAIDTPTPTP